MAKVKYVDAFCSHCGTERKLEISGEAFSDESGSKKWAKCKKCKQMIMVDIVDILGPEKISLDELDSKDVKTYAPGNTYDIGEAIYHENWDDFGRVISKEILSNGKQSITVEFQKSGNKKLIESINI